MIQTTKAGIDEALDALANVHRRRLLVALLEQDPQDDTVQVPEEIHVGETELDRLQTQLFHKHLPKLKQAGFILWDQTNHEVETCPTFDEIRQLLELIHSHQAELPGDWV